MKAPNLVSVSSACVLHLLLWVLCSVASGLIGNYEAPQALTLTTTPATTPAFTSCSNRTESPINKTGNVSYGENEFGSELGCGNKTSYCIDFCKLCDELFHTRMECYSNLYDIQCHKPFKEGMESFNHTDWCNWENVKRMYNTFTLCTEDIAECLKIPWPNWMVENRFVEIHSVFFRDCPNEELSDPPPSIVFALVMAPICLIPVMVVLVVLKTKNGDGNS